ncbi:hypothetical protein G3N95_20510 [Paraburkholderia sp. Tr-20389]|uniref:hypothetical protein n=1 Tax=Paraburkholderia sp. Tr-20389 TaxID=2703903 RepID=UPI00198241C7|nr:hypothetical protein [Paraburkholderia sp. Tr-20389]MBN3755339.1 hypothetical protein [Paraburkholderia sp. Tr-20389]
MTSSSNFAAKSSFLDRRIHLLEALLQEAVVAGERHVRQFAQCAVLIRTIETSRVRRSDRVKLLSALEALANEAETNARFDLEVFQSLLAGQLMKRQLARVSD